MQENSNSHYVYYIVFGVESDLLLVHIFRLRVCGFGLLASQNIRFDSKKTYSKLRESLSHCTESEREAVLCATINLYANTQQQQQQ